MYGYVSYATNDFKHIHLCSVLLFYQNNIDNEFDTGIEPSFHSCCKYVIASYLLPVILQIMLHVFKSLRRPSSQLGEPTK